MSWGDGDFNGDETVNDIDATMMAGNWGKSKDGLVTNPEPAAIQKLATL